MVVDGNFHRYFNQWLYQCQIRPAELSNWIKFIIESTRFKCLRVFLYLFFTYFFLIFSIIFNIFDFFLSLTDLPFNNNNNSIRNNNNNGLVEYIVLNFSLKPDGPGVGEPSNVKKCPKKTN